jgi:hypothetical protein
MRWVHEMEEHVSLNHNVDKTFIVTRFECDRCPTTSVVTHELPYDYHIIGQESETDTNSSIESDSSPLITR